MLITYFKLIISSKKNILFRNAFNYQLEEKKEAVYLDGFFIQIKKIRLIEIPP